MRGEGQRGRRDRRKEVGEGTEQGKMIGNGAVATGKARGHKRVPHGRGQAIPAWDPRPLKATGVTYAAGPMGADHTANHHQCQHPTVRRDLVWSVGRCAKVRFGSLWTGVR